jgi:hypothetical protein
LLSKYSKAQIKPKDILPHFHLNTLLHRIFRQLEKDASATKEGWTSLLDWTKATQGFSSYLPNNITIKDGETGKLVNPWKPIEDCFGSPHEFCQESLYNSIKEMHIACLGKYGQYHLNIVEVLSNSSVLTPEHVKDFSKNILGMEKTPSEIMDDFINETQGDCILGNAQEVALENNGALYTSSPKNQQVWIEKNKIYAHGYWGTISEFDLFISNEENDPIKHVVIIQRRNLNQTSVTNLAETLRDKIKHEFGENTQVYEAYQEDCINGQFEKLDLIVGNMGETAGWIPTRAETVPGFVNFTLD